MNERAAENLNSVGLAALIYAAVRLVIEGPDGMHANAMESGKKWKEYLYNMGFKAGERDARKDKEQNKRQTLMSKINPLYISNSYYKGYRAGYLHEWPEGDDE